MQPLAHSGEPDVHADNTDHFAHDVPSFDPCRATQIVMVESPSLITAACSIRAKCPNVTQSRMLRAAYQTRKMQSGQVDSATQRAWSTRKPAALYGGGTPAAAQTDPCPACPAERSAAGVRPPPHLEASGHERREAACVAASRAPAGRRKLGLEAANEHCSCEHATAPFPNPPTSEPAKRFENLTRAHATSIDLRPAPSAPRGLSDGFVRRQPQTRGGDAPRASLEASCHRRSEDAGNAAAERRALSPDWMRAWLRGPRAASAEARDGNAEKHACKLRFSDQSKRCESGTRECTSSLFPARRERRGLPAWRLCALLRGGT